MAYQHALKLGDLVRLKSGGPLMTVELVGSKLPAKVFCVWFVGEQVVRATFRPETIDVIAPPVTK